MSASLDLDTCRTPWERAVLAALDARRARWEAQGIALDDAPLFEDGDRLVLLLAGQDETQQGGPLLDPRAAGVSVFDGDSDGAAAATAAWLERELMRPIDRAEWITPGFRHRVWRYADDGQELCWSDSHNVRDRALGDPTSTIRVRPI
jgi:hypothetical protein